MTQETAKNGEWELEKKQLGQGGFGVVELWKHKENGERLAIKRCRMESQMSQKHKDRWNLEVNIMLKLNHDNIVKAYKVPEGLRDPDARIPALAMEYCAGGDLRKVLYRPENAHGLKEFECRAVARDIASAIEHLHRLNIIHRDIKPENVVLHPADDKIVYKLIDLGYAKDLDENSICSSYVGTLQYLAPELFSHTRYTLTVDYWSFGTTVFECLTGIRPFLHSYSPGKWQEEVSKKENRHIHAYIGPENKIKFSEKLPEPNHLCRTTQVYFESFLRLMLVWNPAMRGGGIDQKSNRPKCFQLLHDIISTKLIRVYCVPFAQELIYPCPTGIPLSKIQSYLEQETKIPIQDQELLLTTGQTPNPDVLAEKCCATSDTDEMVVYLFHRDDVTFPEKEQRVRSAPELVQMILSKPSAVMSPLYNSERRENSGRHTELPPSEWKCTKFNPARQGFDVGKTNNVRFQQDQKNAWSQAVYYCDCICQDFKRLHGAQRTANVNLMRLKTLFSRTKIEMVSIGDEIKAKINFYMESVEYDIKKLEAQESEGIYSQNMHKSWIKMIEEIAALKSLSEEANRMQDQCSALDTRVIELQRSPFAKAKQSDKLQNLYQRCLKMYDDFRRNAKNNPKPENAVMVKLIVECISEWDQQCRALFVHLRKIMECRKEVQRLSPIVKDLRTKMIEARQAISSKQRQRQRDMWHMISVVLKQSQNLTRTTSSSTQATSSPGSSAGIVSQPTDSTCTLAGPLSASNNPPGSATSESSSMFIQKCSEASTLILNESIHNRHRLQMMTQSFAGPTSLMPSLADSLDWSFLNDATHTSSHTHQQTSTNR